jgi:hypothetical protein
MDTTEDVMRDFPINKVVSTRYLKNVMFTDEELPESSETEDAYHGWLFNFPSLTQVGKGQFSVTYTWSYGMWSKAEYDFVQ